MKLNIIKYVTITSLLIMNKNVFALGENFKGWYNISKSSIICAKKDYGYQWLDNEKVDGYWKEYTDFDKGFIFHYFYLTEGEEKYDELKNKCIKNFGDEFIYPQPAHNRFSSWFPFAKNQNEMFPSAFITKSYTYFKTIYKPN